MEATIVLKVWDATNPQNRGKHPKIVIHEYTATITGTTPVELTEAIDKVQSELSRQHPMYTVTYVLPDKVTRHILS